ncbi:MAG TPA: DUF3352 domain-containing protein [Candidatus Saccharimonadales bacterium]|nr:DUF3352 domain-containing protein [Candidatus Saccharimonadales bacterium]
MSDSNQGPLTPPSESAPRPTWSFAGDSPDAGPVVAPVVPTRRPASPGSTTRWGIALVITALVVGIASAGFFILSSGAATSNLVDYVPINSVGYFEVRLDAPGDQRQNAANVLSHFPGFLDQSDLGLKIDEALDQAIGGVTANKDNYTTQIKPWLGDAMAVALSPPPTAGTTMRPGGLYLVATKDPRAAGAWAASILGPGTSTETYGGVALTVIEHSGHRLVYGVVGTVLIAGDEDAAKAAIDTQGNSTFAGGPSFSAAVAATSGDHLVFGFLDLQSLLSRVAAAAPTASSLSSLISAVPAWAAVTIRAEGNGLSSTVVFPQTPLTSSQTNTVSSIAPRLPATTIAAFEAHSIGALVTNTISTAQVRSGFGTSPSPGPLDQALKAVGGINRLIGWMGDGSLVVVGGGAQPSVGLAIEAKDAQTAGDEVAQIKNLVALAGAAASVTTHDETYDGTTITIIDLGNAQQLLGSRAAMLPAGVGGRIEIAVAQKDDLVLAGLGDAFVKSMLDAKPGSSLADQARYREAVNAAGASNTGQAYLDLAAIVNLVESEMPADARASFDTNDRPYLAPLKAFAAAGTAGDPTHAHFIVIIH